MEVNRGIFLFLVKEFKKYFCTVLEDRLASAVLAFRTSLGRLSPAAVVSRCLDDGFGGFAGHPPLVILPSQVLEWVHPRLAIVADSNVRSRGS